MTQRPKKLLDQVRDAIRLKHYAYSTEKSHVYWAKRFVLYHDRQHPREMAEKEISEFLTYLAAEEHVAASTQNQGLSALLFLYREVLPWLHYVCRDLPLRRRDRCEHPAYYRALSDKKNTPLALLL